MANSHDSRPFTTSGDQFPHRIVCLTEETTETLYLLGEGDRVVGISGYTVRPPEARQKPKVSSFLSARYEKIAALAPDLVLAFSDLQADITTELVKRGYPVFTFNQRSVAGILQMIRVLGGHRRRGRQGGGARRVARTRPGRHPPIGGALPRVVRASISRNGTSRSSAASAGSRSWWRLPAARRSSPSFARPRSARTASSRRSVSSPPRPRCSSARGAASRCKKDKVRARAGWGEVPFMRDGRLFEVKSTYILQPGPAALTEGVRQMHALLCGARSVCDVPGRAQARPSAGTTAWPARRRARRLDRLHDDHDEAGGAATGRRVAVRPIGLEHRALAGRDHHLHAVHRDRASPSST